MNERIIKIDEATRNRLEMLHYDIQTMQGLLAFMLDKDMDINSGAGLKYQTELIAKKKLYEAAKSEITEKHIPVEMRTPDNYWDMNFRDSSLVIRSRSDGRN